MKLTPLDIRNQEFKKAMRGFDPVEVQTFLEMVSEHYEQLAEENKTLDRRIVELETKLQDYQANEKNLRETLLNVQEVKKQSEESSRRQADLLVKEAELKALEILETARKQTRQIREEVSWLKSQKESFINRLRHILVSQIELLSVMEIDDLLPPETQDAFKTLKARKYAQLTQPGRTEEPKQPEQPEAESSSESPLEAEQPEIVEEKLTKKAVLAENEIPETPKENPEENEKRIIHRMNSGEVEEVPVKPKKKAEDDSSLTEDDINDFFKKGIQIDELIKTINKKEFDK